MAEMKTKRTLIPAYGADDIGDVIINMSIQCLVCKHLDDKILTCKAYPKGIPQKIIDGKHDHTQPFKGDNGIRFEEL